MDDVNKPVIMIVDDEPLNIYMLRESLKDDYKLIIATRGAQALTLAEKKMPDLILLDIMMPEMDGYEACIKLKENDKTKDIPVFFITALNDDEDKSIGYEYGAEDFITKPFDIKEVRKRINLYLTLQIQEQKIKEFEKQLKDVYISGSNKIHPDIISQISGFNTTISGNIQIIKLFWTLAEPIILNHTDEDKTGRIGEIVGKFSSMVNGIIENTRNINNVLNDRALKEE